MLKRLWQEAIRLWQDAIRAAGYLLIIVIGIGSVALAYGAFSWAVAFFFVPEQSVHLLNPGWHIEPRTNTMVLDWATIKNNSPFELKDFVIGCEVRGDSGTLIATMTATVYQMLKSNAETPILALPLSGRYPDQGTSTVCKVIGVSHQWN
jgi:hypothetical protein